VTRYWADSLLFKELTADEREFYIGLWMEADDAGWLTLDVAEMAAELYRYEPVVEREAKVTRQVEHLKLLKRLQVFECGHGLVPNLVKHQRFGGELKRVYTVRDAHTRDCLPAGTGEDPRAPAGPRAGIGKEKEKKRDRYPAQNEDRDDIDGVEEFIEHKWGWGSLTPKQRILVVDIADRLAEGSKGFARVREILEDTEASDPIRVLRDYADSLSVAGEARAAQQERDSQRWRQRDAGAARSDLEAIGATLARTLSTEQAGEGVRVLSES
jgi:hypothetical protein